MFEQTFEWCAKLPKLTHSLTYHLALGRYQTSCGTSCPTKPPLADLGKIPTTSWQLGWQQLPSSGRSCARLPCCPTNAELGVKDEHPVQLVVVEPASAVQRYCHNQLQGWFLWLKKIGRIRRQLYKSLNEGLFNDDMPNFISLCFFSWCITMFTAKYHYNYNIWNMKTKNLNKIFFAFNYEWVLSGTSSRAGPPTGGPNAVFLWGRWRQPPQKSSLCVCLLESLMFKMEKEYS